MKPDRHATHFLRSALCAAVLFTSGCANLYPELKDYEATPKTVDAQQYTYGTDANFAAGDAILPREEEQRLAHYIERMAIGKYDEVTLVAFNDAAPSNLIERRLAAVQGLLKRQNVPVHGVQWSDGFAAETPENGDAGRIRILVDRYLITLPGCPDWTKSPTGSFDNQVHSNWGCATATNLGAMLAEPRDLIQGRANTYTDGNYAVKSIQRYRSGETKEITAQATSDSM